MLKLISSFSIGLVFGVGILVSGMANPAKVLNFFDLFGTWDPSLAFVMGGALIVTFVGYRLVLRRSAPLLDSNFSLPTKSDLDARLIGGSAIFGIGWGISGFCPGGLVPALGLGRAEPFYAIGGILIGISLAKLAIKALDAKTESKADIATPATGNT
ncbi:conserved hypothetical protein [Roseibium sp. TrichSKD4]|uniref:DUF6691 family protein n=1 Tax=Roseibium sp. TrichSKD4 TaxID=744980 RepID=UPI0001E567B3|nr:DUF6691 family protein [Roseibium sp. TrichSKD4]EFO31241.1 conserved hypothetical protein [Roseibium sp. TrichSKD4]